jgi:hypothetical protein
MTEKNLQLNGSDPHTLRDIGMCTSSSLPSGQYPSSCLSFKNTMFLRLDCLSLQVEFTQLGATERVTVSRYQLYKPDIINLIGAIGGGVRREGETSSFYWAHLSKCHMKTETESSL